MTTKSEPVVTRFAPSPTGFLHIGGARTALFNWLFTRHHGGEFRLRIEDTDRARSTKEAIDAILEGLHWLGLEWDGEVVYQSERAQRHAAVALELVQAGNAYRCYCTPEELTEMRAKARSEGSARLYDGRWRDRDPADAPPGVDPVIRLKVPLTGETVIDDAVQGEVTVPNAQLDDMVLLRADQTPTYMLSVVVDDHDMGITHAIRGDDHLTNAFRQTQLFRAAGWPEPCFAHIPLIHGADGAKLSKRHGALGIEAYRDMGYLPQALTKRHGALGIEAYRDMGYLPQALMNYLLRLGWSHGDAEIIDLEQAIAWFDLADVNKAAARFDFDKLNSLNAHYLREMEDLPLVDLIRPRLERMLGSALGDVQVARLGAGMSGLKARAKTLEELAENALFYVTPRPLEVDEKARNILSPEACALLKALTTVIEGDTDWTEAGDTDWTEAGIEASAREFAEEKGLKLGKIAQPLRAALTGTTASPGIFEVMAVLGREETLARIGDHTS
jgi:glutamyl-tRNA synthetase